MKKKVSTIIIGAVLALSIGACGTKEEDSASAPQTASGGAAETIYQQSCASCHGNNLQGQIGPSLTKVGGKYSQEDIEHIIENGRGSMPAGVIKGQDVNKVAEWLAEKK